MCPTEEGNFVPIAEIRREKLEKLLQSKVGYTKKDLLKKLGEQLAEFRDSAENCLRTLDYDLNYLKKKGCKLIREKRTTVNFRGRKVSEWYFRYENPKWSFKKYQIDPDTLLSVKVAAGILKEIPGIQLHNDLKDIYAALMEQADSISDDDRPYLLFSKRQGVSGLHHIPKILGGIIDQGVVEFSYQPYNSPEANDETVSPYLLKEYNGRWYLIGYSERKADIQHYGLDRIKSKGVKRNNKKEFIKSNDFEPAEYFRYVIGTSVPKEKYPEEIVLKFNEKRGIHVLHAPIHFTQEIVRQNTSHITFKYKLVINAELENQILSFGADVEIIAPEDLRNKIAEVLKKAGEMYKDNASILHDERIDLQKKEHGTSN